MKTGKLFLVTVLTTIAISASAENLNNEEPKGKVILQLFENFHTGFGAEKNDRGFELERSYFGYEYNLKNGLSVKGVMDIGKSSDIDDLQRIVYLKNAMLSWESGDFKISTGLIPTTQFSFLEKFWGYRYIIKSFQDKYKFGCSADLGLSLSYKSANWISVDVIVVNGEGYKKIQNNDGLNYGLGTTISPIKDFYVRLYGGLNESGEKGKKDIVNLSAFLGYKSNKFTIGTEYNIMKNVAYKEDANEYGYSIYTSLNLSENSALYARFDDVYSNNDWNSEKDESAAILGVQFKLGKYVKIAPNFRMSIPKADDIKNGYSAYVNCFIGF